MNASSTSAASSVSAASSASSGSHEVHLASLSAHLREQHVHTVELAATDMYAHLRGRRIPTERFLTSVVTAGANFPEALFAATIECDIVDSPTINMDTGFRDVHLQPDLASARVFTHRPGYALVFADVHAHGGTPHPMSARDLLRAQVARCAALGFEPYVATELEFYLMTPDGLPVSPAVQYGSLTEGQELEVVIADMRRALVGAGLDVENSNTEFGPSQVEINVGPSDAMRAADNTVLFRSITKEIARQHGYRASFMPKPILEASGSGMHVHMSLTRDGTNAFADCTDGPSGPMAHWTAGLVAHAPAMTLLATPSLNGYRRYAPYTFAPVVANWGGDNRTVLARCLTDEGAANRVEFRLAGADANPYLLLAAILAAGSDGLERGLELPSRADGDTYTEPGAVTPLPATHPDAVAAYETSALAAMFPAPLNEMVTVLAGAEHEIVGAHLDADPESVSEVELQRYLFSC